MASYKTEKKQKNTQRGKHENKKQNLKEKNPGFYTRKGVKNRNENLQISLKISVTQYMRKKINIWDKITNHSSLRIGNDGRSVTNQKKLAFYFPSQLKQIIIQISMNQ